MQLVTCIITKGHYSHQSARHIYIVEQPMWACDK